MLYALDIGSGISTLCSGDCKYTGESLDASSWATGSAGHSVLQDYSALVANVTVQNKMI